MTRTSSRRPDGSLFTISARLGPVYGADGSVIGVSVHIRDTTAQEQAEATAHGSQERLRSIVEVSTDVTDSKHAERELRERRNWEEQLGRALNEGRLLVYAQPIIDIASGELYGEELLVRMQGENGPHDVVRPDEFLPQAERFGLMPMIDRFMLGEALKLASTGRQISVNVSATSIPLVSPHWAPGWPSTTSARDTDLLPSCAPSKFRPSRLI